MLVRSHWTACLSTDGGIVDASMNDPFDRTQKPLSPAVTSNSSPRSARGTKSTGIGQRRMTLLRALSSTTNSDSSGPFVVVGSLDTFAYATSPHGWSDIRKKPATFSAPFPGQNPNCSALETVARPPANRRQANSHWSACRIDRLVPLSACQECEPFKEVHVLLVLQQRAVKWGDEFRRVAFAQGLRRDVVGH
jgi:hypothetical protein